MSVPMTLGEFHLVAELLADLPIDRPRVLPAKKPKRKPDPASGDARLRYLARRLWALGERPTYEFLKELRAGHDLIDTLERYARLDPKFIRSLGGDAFSVGVIGGGRTS